MKLIMYRGDSAVFNFSLKLANGDPLDPTGGSLWFTGKTTRYYEDTSATFQKTLLDGITIVDGPTGSVSVTLDPEDTETMYAPNVIYWDLQFATAGGGISTLISGELLIKPDVTRSTS
jgi:hypothetical protein